MKLILTRLRIKPLPSLSFVTLFPSAPPFFFFWSGLHYVLFKTTTPARAGGLTTVTIFFFFPAFLFSSIFAGFCLRSSFFLPRSFSSLISGSGFRFVYGPVKLSLWRLGFFHLLFFCQSAFFWCLVYISLAGVFVTDIHIPWWFCFCAWPSFQAVPRGRTKYCILQPIHSPFPVDIQYKCVPWYLPIERGSRVHKTVASDYRLLAPQAS